MGPPRIRDVQSLKNGRIPCPIALHIESVHLEPSRIGHLPADGQHAPQTMHEYWWMWRARTFDIVTQIACLLVFFVFLVTGIRWPVDWLNQNSGYNWGRILVLCRDEIAFFIIQRAVTWLAGPTPRIFSSSTGLSWEGCSLLETIGKSWSVHATSITPDNKILNYLHRHSLYFPYIFPLSYYRYL